MLLFIRRQRLRQRQLDAREAATTATSESLSSDSSVDMKMDKSMVRACLNPSKCVHACTMATTAVCGCSESRKGLTQ